MKFSNAVQEATVAGHKIAATNSSGLASLINLIGFVIAAILIYRYFAA